MIIDLFGVLLTSENKDYLKKPPHFFNHLPRSFKQMWLLLIFTDLCHHQYLSKRSDSKHSLETIGMVQA